MTFRTRSSEQSYHALAQYCIEKWSQPGLSIIVVGDDDVQYQAGFGVASLDSKEIVSPDTVFAIASCSKPFASASVALLVDEGKIHWDDRIIDHLPNFELSDPWVTQEVRIRDLLCNRLGIVGSEGIYRPFCIDRNELVRKLRFHKFRHSFRSEYGYCTDAFTVIGELVTTVARQDWASFVKERIWSPLGMDTSNADWRSIPRDVSLASPHSWCSDQFITAPWWYEDHVATPAGGVNASISDLGKWLMFWLRGPSGSIISTKSFEEILRPHTAEREQFADREFSGVAPLPKQKLFRHEAYALGWYVHNYCGETVYHHVGSIDGFRSAMAFAPGLDLGVAVLANADNGFLPRAIVQSIIDMQLGHDFGPWVDACHLRDIADRKKSSEHVYSVVQSKSLPLNQYVGSYSDAGCFGEANISLVGSRLMMRLGAKTVELQNLDAETFVVLSYESGYRRIFFELEFDIADKRIAGFRLSNGSKFKRLYKEG